MDVSVIIPTFNEAPNVAELIERIEVALLGRRGEILFVDDSSDDTPTVIEAAAAHSSFPVRLIRRPRPVGGLSGAVLEGLRVATSDWCVVMDGDLQHPPEVIPALLESGIEQDADLVADGRLRQEFRDFRLDRIAGLHLSSERFAPRPDTLQSYWAQQARRCRACKST